MSYPDQTAYQPGSDRLGVQPFPNQRAYSHWGKRVGAALIDWFILVPFWVPAVIVVVVTHSPTP